MYWTILLIVWSTNYFRTQNFNHLSKLFLIIYYMDILIWPLEFKLFETLISQCAIEYLRADHNQNGSLVSWLGIIVSSCILTTFYELPVRLGKRSLSIFLLSISILFSYSLLSLIRVHYIIIRSVRFCRQFIATATTSLHSNQWIMWLCELRSKHKSQNCFVQLSTF